MPIWWFSDLPGLTVGSRLSRVTGGPTGRRGRSFRARLGARENDAASNAPLLNIAAKPLKGEWLIVVTNVAPRTALETYRKRWAIECLFGEQSFADGCCSASGLWRQS